MSYSFKDLENAIAAVGIEPGDLVMAHIAVEQFGIPLEIAEGKFPGGKIKAMYAGLAELFEGYFQDRGTFLIPAFSYSFCGGDKRFDPKTTPSTVGGFSNYIIRNARWRRSIDPLFSMVGFGPLIDELFDDLAPTSFGENGIFDRLLKKNAKICLLGIGLDTLTAFHHIEYRLGAPYRYDKVFRGFLVTDNGEQEIDWTYYVRAFDPRTVHRLKPFQEEAISLGMVRKAQVGDHCVYGFELNKIFDLVREHFERDPFAFIQEPIPQDELERMIREDLEKSKK